MAPYAYRLGVISGKTVIQLVVEKDGRVQSHGGAGDRRAPIAARRLPGGPEGLRALLRPCRPIFPKRIL